jgi:hypothetical protein
MEEAIALAGVEERHLQSAQEWWMWWTEYALRILEAGIPGSAPVGEFRRSELKRLLSRADQST